LSSQSTPGSTRPASAGPGRPASPGRLGARPRTWLLFVLVVVLVLAISLPLHEWLLPPEPELEEPLPFGISPEARARIEKAREEIRKRGHHWEAGYTEVSDLDAEAFQQLLGARPPAEEILKSFQASGPESSAPAEDLPEHWDWREQGGVTAARRQGQCGSCWAFAAAGALESLARIYDGRSVDLSEQHALDCNPDGHGCDGGWMTAAYRLWQAGAPAEAQLPYLGDDDRACAPGDFEAVVRVLDWSAVSSGRDALKRMLLVSPLAVTMHVYPDFQDYRAGVYEHAGDEAVNHAVLLVGWDDRLQAWIIKNSWGAAWGTYGFAYVRYDCCHLGAYAHRVGMILDHPLALRHEALRDTLAGCPLAITATVTSAGDPIDTASVRVWVDLGSGAHPQRPVRSAGNAHQGTFVLALPEVAGGTRVRYWLEAADLTGHAAILPQAGSGQPFEFEVRRLAGRDSFELPPAWNPGIPGDAATAGGWEWGLPQVTYDLFGRVVQPGGDHSGAGDFCYATGLACGADAEANDVDGGVATLESPSYDLSGLNDAILRFWLWYSNHLGASPYRDAFLVRASSDGGRTWVEVFRTREGSGSWRPVLVPLETHLPLTGDVRFRFVVADSLEDSLIEALIDDFDILTATPAAAPADTVSAAEPRAEARARITSNPAVGAVTVLFDLPAPAMIAGQLFDASGRCLRRLDLGQRPAGRTRLTWDACDDRGRPLDAGTYWLQLSVGGRRETHRLVLLR